MTSRPTQSFTRIAILISLIAASTISIVVGVTWTKHERVDIRYHPPEPLSATASFWDTDGVKFRIDKDLLLLTVRGDDVELSIPSDLQDSDSWRLIEDRDEQILILSCTRGMAVWENQEPFRRRHVWPAIKEPMAGGETGGVRHSGNRVYKLAKFDVQFSIAPDGKRVCLHVTGQNSGSYLDENRAFVLIREVSSGKDLLQIEHPEADLVINKVAWSGDSERLATFTSLNHHSEYQTYVWNSHTGERLASVKGIAAQIRLDHDGERLFILTELHPRLLSIYFADTGEHLISRKSSHLRSFHLSPDNQMMALIHAPSGFFGGHRDRIELVEIDTLKRRWASSCKGAIGQLAFKEDGSEVAANWFIPNELFGSQAGLRAWDTKDGTVVLDEGRFAFDGRLFYRGEQTLQAGNFLLRSSD